MFANLIFLILVLLLINFSGELDPVTWSQTASSAFLEGVLYFLGLLALIALQTISLKKWMRASKSSLQLLVNCELLLFLAVYHFFLGGHRLFNTWTTASALFSLGFYFVGLFFFHYVYSKLTHAPQPITSSFHQVRLILPFAIPFLLFTLMLDLVAPISPSHNSVEGSLVVFAVTMVFMGLMLILLPPLIVTIWQCKPIEPSPIKERLDSLCSKAHFRHGGMLYWTVMNSSLTAGIVGILPRLRYVMFTKRLLHELSPNATEAILAHEIGHSYHRHLLIYPFIIFGMVICTALFSLLFSDAITLGFNRLDAFYPSTLWSFLYPATLFFIYALIIGIYFRYVFGLFSRLFERQADLHGFALDLPPQHMIEALDDVAVATGFTHLVPNWHHYSLQERMDFLQSAIANPKVIDQHHRHVKYTLYVYFALLAVGSLFAFAPLWPEAPVLKPINECILWLSKYITDLIT